MFGLSLISLIFSFFLFRLNFLCSLVLLELSSLLGICFFLKIFGIWMCVPVLVIGAIESCLGLSMLVYLSRSYSSSNEAI